VITDSFKNFKKLFLKARSIFPNEPPFQVFHRSCYDFICSIAFAMNPLLDELEFTKEYGSLLVCFLLLKLQECDSFFLHH